MMSNRGMTLIELMLTISVAGILVVALAFEFRGWIGRYGVEVQTKELYTDIMNARAGALQKKRTHFVQLTGPTTYSVFEDDSDGAGESLNGDGILQPGVNCTDLNTDCLLEEFPKTVDFDLRWDGAVIAAPRNITFTPRGLVTTNGEISVFVDRNGDGDQDFFPDYGCIIIHTTRINPGVWNDTTNACDAR
jgi:type IV fimbrial biogenesis protein FimT